MAKTTDELLRENCFLQGIAEILVERLETCEDRVETIAHLLIYGYSNEELMKIGYEQDEITDANKLLEEEEHRF